MLLCCSGLRHHMFIAFLVENRACDVLSPVSVGFVKSSLSMCLNDFQSGLLSKGPEESADLDHDQRLRHHHHHNIHHYHWLWSSGQVGVQWNCIIRSKRLATRRPTSNSHGRGRSRPQPRGGRGRGGYHGRGRGVRCTIHACTSVVCTCVSG